MAQYRTCDGVARRDFLKVGAIGATGLTLANYLQMAEAGDLAKGTARSAIFVNLRGGPSHMDTFDLKPDAPSEYRGEFNPISTKVSGVEFSEHLPNLAQCADKFAILRGVSHSLGAHALGQEYINTGNRPLPSLDYPSYGSVVSKELTNNTDLPTYVAVPNANHKSGFLGVKYNPLETGSVPRPGAPYSVRGLNLRNGLTVTDVEKRSNLLKDLDGTFKGLEKDNQLLEGLDEFSQQAHTMITSKDARTAFDVSKESPEFSKKFGEHTFGMSCLLATRLVEAGVRFVTLSLGGWDTHRDNWTALKERQLPPFDQGLSALLTGLAEKGLLETTTVFVTGEFGRTPKINTTRNGRDHYPRNMFMLMAGGGVQGGQVLGKSDEKGTLPIGKGFSPDDAAATLYHTLGISRTKEYHTNTGRPIMVVRDGQVIEKLFS